MRRASAASPTPPSSRAMTISKTSMSAFHVVAQPDDVAVDALDGQQFQSARGARPFLRIEQRRRADAAIGDRADQNAQLVDQSRRQERAVDPPAAFEQQPFDTEVAREFFQYA